MRKTALLRASAALLTLLLALPGPAAPPAAPAPLDPVRPAPAAPGTQASQAPAGKPVPPRVHPVTGAKLFALQPGLDIAPDAKEAYVQAKVALDSGILEFLLVQGETKSYEAALTTAVRPSQLMAGLLLLDWKPGDLLGLTLLRGRDTLSMRDLIRARDTAAGRAGEGQELRFRLVGSNHAELGKGKKGFWADREGLHIALVDRAESVLQLDGPLKNPYHNAAFGYEMRKGPGLKAGSPITVILRRPKAP